MHAEDEQELGYMDRSDCTPPDTLQATKYPSHDTAALEAAVELINLRQQRVEHFSRTPVLDREWLETNQIRADEPPRERAEARLSRDEEPPGDNQFYFPTGGRKPDWLIKLRQDASEAVSGLKPKNVNLNINLTPENRPANIDVKPKK